MGTWSKQKRHLESFLDFAGVPLDTSNFHRLVSGWQNIYQAFSFQIHAGEHRCYYSTMSPLIDITKKY